MIIQNVNIDTNDIKVDDYIITSCMLGAKEIDNFVKNNIGKVTYVSKSIITAKYNKHEIIKTNFKLHNRKYYTNEYNFIHQEVLFFSKCKETVETFLESKKYNL